MANHSINLNTYYIRKSSIDNADLVSDSNGPDETSHSGLMTPAQKTKLDGIATNANNYTHPTPSNLGGAKNQDLYFIAIDANGHITQATQTPIELNLNGAEIQISDRRYGSNLLDTDWVTYYALFEYDITQLLEDNNNGKTLSTNDYTTADKTALTNLKTHVHGNITNAGSITTVIDAIDTTLDKLIVSDNSDSNKLKSVSFVDALDDVIQDLIQLGE